MIYSGGRQAGAGLGRKRSMYFQGQLLAVALRGCGGGGGGGGGEGRTISWPHSCGPLCHCGTGPTPPTPDNRSPGAGAADMGVEAFRAKECMVSNM